MNTAEIRLLDKNLEDKIAINKFNKEYLIWCANCDSGIDEYKLPIHYSKEQKIEIENKYKKTHSYCLSCLKIMYMRDFGLRYDEIIKK